MLQEMRIVCGPGRLPGVSLASRFDGHTYWLKPLKGEACG